MRDRGRQVAMRERVLRPADVVAPVEVSASAPADGNSVTVVFAEGVKGFVAGDNGFALTASGGAVTLTYSSGNGTNTIVFTTSRSLLQGETVTLAYTPGAITDLVGNPLAAFSGASVTNNSEELGLNFATVPDSQYVYLLLEEYLM